MDDPGAIVFSPYVYGGEWLQGGMRGFTYLSYWTTYSLFGMNPLAFHAGNILIHCALAVCIYLFAGRFLREKSGAQQEGAPVGFPLVAALIFAVHPLAAEVTHYARARDHELVGLFSFLTAVAALDVLRRGSRGLPSLLLAILLGALSKEQGLVQCLLAAGIVGAFYWDESVFAPGFKKIPKRFFAYAVVVGALLALILFTGPVLFWWKRVCALFDNPELGFHTLTQSRLVWEYLVRMVVPLRLCADHQIAMTVSNADTGAWVAFVAAIGMVLAVAALHRKGYTNSSFLLAMALAPIFVRFAYTVETTLMVEYRAYPALPWAAMLVSLGLCRTLASKPAALKLSTAAVVVLLSALTFSYGRAWRSTEALVAHILKIYPTQLRAIIELNGSDLFFGNYSRIIERAGDFCARVSALGDSEKVRPERRYRGTAYFAARFNLQLAEALVGAGDCDAALRVLDSTKSLISQMVIPGQDMRRFAGIDAEWHLVKSLAEACKGNDKLAGMHRELAFSEDSPVMVAREMQARNRYLKTSRKSQTNDRAPAPERGESSQKQIPASQPTNL